MSAARAIPTISEGKTLILGIGNLLLSDDGFGIHVIQRMEAEGLAPEGVEVIDGGTLGLNLLYYLEDVKRLIIIDAMEMHRAPGTLARISGEQVPAYLSMKVSPHQVSLPDLLLAAQFTGHYPKEVVILGVQPQTMETGLELSLAVETQVDRVVEWILEEIERKDN